MPSIGFSQDSGLELFVRREPFIPGWDSTGAITHWSISKDPDLIIHFASLFFTSALSFGLLVSLYLFHLAFPCRTLPLSHSFFFCGCTRVDGSPRVHLHVDLRRKPNPFPISATQRSHTSPRLICQRNLMLPRRSGLLSAMWCRLTGSV